MAGVASAAALAPRAPIAIVGAGAMGSGIAQVAALAGHDVMLFDTRVGGADAAVGRLADTFAMLAAKGKLSADAARHAAARITAVHALADAANARLVIEAVVEDQGVKRQLFDELEGIVASDAILATNTSSLSITALAAGCKHPARVVGMHFFNPAPLLPLVEVVAGLATDPAVAATIYATAQAWGKTPVHARSTPGFIVNRCARPFYGEAWRLLGERAASPATIDAVMREAGGFRMGPFELMDLVGHDINFAVTSSVYDAMFQDPRFKPSVLQRELVAAGRLGRKSGRGLYDYGDGAARPVAATEAAAPPPAGMTVHGDLGLASALATRMHAGGVSVATAAGGIPPALVAQGAMAVGDTWLVASDGRTATARAAASGVRNLVVFDLARDYGSCQRLAVASADACPQAAFVAATAALQAAGVAVSRLDDVAGLVVLRTVAMLTNEAADAASEGIATPADIDVAMRLGVNYPAGPLEWGDALGVARVRSTLLHLAAHYGEDRYRVSPWLARRAASGMRLTEAA